MDSAVAAMQSVLSFFARAEFAGRRVRVESRKYANLSCDRVRSSVTALRDLLCSAICSLQLVDIASKSLATKLCRFQGQSVRVLCKLCGRGFPCALLAEPA